MVWAVVLAVSVSAAAVEDRLTPEQLLRRAQEVAERISAARSLPLRGPVRAQVLSRAQLVDLVRRRMHEETPPEEIRAEGALLERLGLIESAEDYEDLLYDMFEQQVAGLYDPDDRTTYVLADLYPGEADLTLWHEIVHALQDATFHVGDRQDALEDDGDRSLAYSAICEGDATLTSLALQTGMGWEALQWMLPRDLESLRSMVVPPAGGEYGIPDPLLEVLSFPYVEGVVFVRERWEQGGLAAVDDLFRQPPESTEQVIHAEKYRGADAPVPVRFGDLETAFSGRRVVYDDTMGEFVLRVWLAAFVPTATAIKAAEGWGGDRVALAVPRQAVEPACADGASPLDDRLWSCGAAPECGTNAEARLAESEGWVVWATVWDPADEEHPLGPAGEAEEFWSAVVDGVTQLLGGEEGETVVVDQPPPGREDGGEAGAANGDSRPTRADFVTDGQGRRTWTLATNRGVGGIRRDGLHVDLVLGPPGRTADVPSWLDDLAAAVQVRSADPEPSEPPAVTQDAPTEAGSADPND